MTTPRPWNVHDDGERNVWIGSPAESDPTYDLTVAVIDTENTDHQTALDDARLIVNAVNAHDDLLAACKRWAKWAEQHGTAATAGIACDTFAAIAKAEGGAE